RRCLRRPDSQRRKAGRPAGRRWGQIRAGHQSRHCKGIRRRNPTDAARTRRRGHRMTTKMKRREFITLLGGAAAACARFAAPAIVGVLFAAQNVLLARAQDYPTRPVTLIAPWPAGGAIDTLCRILGPKLSDRLGKPVIIENRRT